MNAGFELTDTIGAIATARGRGAIGIVKISGSRAWAVAEQLFEPRHPGARKNDPPVQDLSRYLQYGWIRHPESGQRIDEVLLARMRAPHTYTGEDVAEINAHGGSQGLAQVLEAVLACGVRLAEPGEFTRRALINGRIDLSQAEAVADLIDARSRKALAIAGRGLEGEVGKRIGALRQRVVDLLAQIEAEIDFGDQIDAESDPKALAAQIGDNVVPVIERWIEHYRQQRGFVEGVKVAAVGRPNVGKSSLINRLIKKERLIVTDVPGTTRDLVDVAITMGDMPLILTDTAGLRDSRDPVESIGIEKTQRYLDECQLILFLMDAADPFGEEDRKICEQLQDRPVVVIFNKMDLLASSVPPALPGCWPKWDGIGISALYDESLEGLERFLLQRMKAEETEGDDDIVPNLRQSRLLENCLQHLQAARERLNDEGELELAAIDLKEALRQLDEILGKGGAEDVLDEVFKRFCIGK